MTNSPSSWNDQVIAEFRANNGTVARFGRNLVLIHHIGAKTGAERIAPARAIRDDHDSWLVAASKGGAPDNPAWYYNLIANPDVRIETPDDGIVAVHAEVLSGAARDAGWERFKEAAPGFRDYEQKTSRVIPVVLLRRRTE
ncbi:nitroreductase/quinone reductase family protein [Amnibacterium sp.]|jgi:deazaflavin-dependent oxidoreductase (nitroreductase family)|uniref:nitroreductase/quinone reductase family protein n=1 Tax=Amnibacterium sp. TaxID=1872496 RepID=UPI00262112E4|nr:nitroreductase/quinone reductase family protein [Amnibacterium sp.]MCU1472260.1 cell entry protein [Amnibacterium sp.]